MGGKTGRRIQVTPSPEAWPVLDELHELTGQSRASMVAELIDAALPALHNSVQAMRIVKEQPLEAQRLLREFADATVGKLGQAQLELDQAITDARTVKGARHRRKS